MLKTVYFDAHHRHKWQCFRIRLVDKNKLGQIIELEDDLVFPLVKSSDIKNPKICGDFKRYVIVTQKKLRQNTSYIEKKSPKTWDYLKTNQELFGAVKALSIKTSLNSPCSV